jgi:hypothetical protein
VRASLSHELGTQTDTRTSPFYAYLVRRLADHKSLTPLYLAAIERLGSLAVPEAVDLLQQRLHAGRWWEPRRTWQVRLAAARALQRLATPEAVEALRAAGSEGSGAVRRVVRSLADDGGRA